VLYGKQYHKSGGEARDVKKSWEFTAGEENRIRNSVFGEVDVIALTRGFIAWFPTKSKVYYSGK